MDELLGKKIQYSAQAEQAVIGSLLIDSRCIPDVLEVLKADDFYLQQNRDIYETVYSMFSFSKSIDVVTVLEEMRIRGLAKDDTAEYMVEIMRLTPTAANVLEYARIVTDKALLRRLSDTADEISKMVSDGEGEASLMLEEAERKIYALRSGRNIGGLVPVSQVVQNVFDILSEAASGDKKFPGIESGLPDIDKQILGLNRSDLILIAARPGMGKTSLALNMALHVGMNLKKTVAVFSLEMSREQLVQRLLSRAAFIPSQYLLTGALSDHQWNDITDAAQRLSEADIRIDDNAGLTVADINAECRRIKNLDLVVIDYLQLMTSSGGKNTWSNESRQQAVSDMSRMLKVMAKELNVPVICLSQLSRASETRTDKRPQLSDLRESGAIEQDADVVIALYRDGYYNKDCENPNLAEALILKNRKGQTGTVELTWLPEYTSFGSVEHRHDDDY